MILGSCTNAAAPDVSNAPVDPQIRLLCFAHAGGNAALFTEWARELGPGVEVIPAQLPGHGNRRAEVPLANIHGLAQPFLELVTTGGPTLVALFGHSMGALVAFELARQMQCSGCAPLCLFASAFRAPQLPDRGPPLHTLTDDEFLAKVADMNGTPEELLCDRHLMRQYLPVFRADFIACETYVYEPAPPLMSPITVLGGADDPEVSREELLAWYSQTTGQFTVEILEGDHFFIRTSRKEVLRHVRLGLEQALQHG
jgi:surfactin synthase thioesterase subunit